MLIPFKEVCSILKYNRLPINGILHIGAHDCEERRDYVENGVNDEDIYWVEGNPDKVLYNKENGVQNIYQALIYDVEKEVEFHVTKDPLNDGSCQSSSILPFETHSVHYPHITVGEVKKMKTVTLESLVSTNNIPIENLTFWNLDIQGVELEALRSAGDLIRFANAIYCEVNVQSLYKGCALLGEVEQFMKEKGFTRVAMKLAEQGWGDALYIKQETGIETLIKINELSYEEPRNKIYGEIPVNTFLENNINSIVNNDNPHTNGEYEFFKTMSNHFKTIVDVGVRDDVYYIKNAPNNCSLFLFEPNPMFFEKLEKNVNLLGQTDKQVKLYNYGLSDKEAKLMYYKRAESFVNRFNEIPSQELNVCRLDSIPEIYALEEISFMKIDTEGYELDVLRGASGILGKTKMVQFEYGGTYPDRNILLKDVVDYLKSHGFSYFYYLIKDYVLCMDSNNVIEHKKYSNILALKNSF